MNREIKNISFMDVNINNGFWEKRQTINAKTSLYSILDYFKESGRIDAFKFDWKEGMPNKPHIFWDSDVAKWIEAASYILVKEPDPELEAFIDGLIELIEKNQDENGYFNIYFTVVEPTQRFKNGGRHELYCAGHLIEAAIAYYNATGKDKFLGLMKKYADHLEKVFKDEGSAGFVTPGHEEIELALVKLYRITKEKKYLELSKFFIDSRGLCPKEKYESGAINERHAQFHLPVREQKTAEGHSVRAVYLYSAMVDIAYEYDDKELYKACADIFENIVTRRMYVTGGIGSSPIGEAFTIDYDLPNLTAYTESCAAIGLAFFAKRMQQLDASSIYADITERLFYNGFLSTVSLDGKLFFYQNPLEIHPELVNRDMSMKAEHRRKLPATQRKPAFRCSCCPPNIARLMASIGDFLYSVEQQTLFVHHYMASDTNTEINDSLMEIVQETNYPSDGNIKITVNGDGAGVVALRIPYWCEKYSLKLNGSTPEFYIDKGYAYVKLVAAAKNIIEVDLKMEIQFIEASPSVQEDSGRIALQRGPVIYCLEAVDNGNLLRDIRIDKESEYELIPSDYFGVPLIKTVGFKRKNQGFESALYKPVTKELDTEELTFIPYFGFTNRGESEMVVWVLEK